MHGMEGNNSGSSPIAPFVMKTYQMVSDPITNGLIAWGRNTIVLLFLSLWISRKGFCRFTLSITISPASCVSSIPIRLKEVVSMFLGDYYNYDGNVLAALIPTFGWFLPVNLVLQRIEMLTLKIDSGFKKVDPDRWEFANEWFLHGQTQLLHNICEERENTNRGYTSLMKHEDDDEEELLVEIAKLKQEQKSF
ncbi:UNVERIFIED_CONTAM: Heat stress transcription factor C-1 [Sesamum calycinum]|uniref:Heat stress transcription factor C-1 n=1 Tax=Sesamum calycinum TaxID=2727403 RepID=A0AAW2SX84_9LAMI